MSTKPTTLTHVETCALVRKAQRGDTEARKQLIAANMGLVWRLALDQCRGDRVKAEEIIAAGICGTDESPSGLVRAIELFDTKRGWKFSTYARYWIKVALRDAAMADRAGRNKVELHWMINRATVKLVHILGRDPTDVEIAEALNRRWAKNGRSRRVTSAIIAIHKHIHATVCIDKLIPYLADEGAENAEQAMIARQAAVKMRAAFDKLDHRQKAILTHRFGLDGREPVPLVDCGKRIGISRERARILEGYALAALRAALLD